jgi:hypothetical protein
VVRRYKDRTYPSYLLRRSYRVGSQVKKQTLGNITHLPPGLIDLVRRGLAGEQVTAAQQAFTITRSLPHGHVAAVLAMVRTLGLEAVLARTPSRARALAVGMVVGRILAPASKLATRRTWGSTTLGETLEVADATENELYAASDWLLARQPVVERALAQRHLPNGVLVLYDVSSTYLEGHGCPLARHGYSRDHRPDRPQIVFGLVLDEVGRPLAVEAFAGNTADPATVDAQLEKIRTRLGLHDVILVGDRGMLTPARIDRLKGLGGWGWISCPRAPAIATLVEQGAVQLSLFDERNLVEVAAPAYPGARLLVCKNPLVAAERARKREALLARTEQALARVAALVAGGRLKTAAQIGLRVGRVVHRWQMAKHFTLLHPDDWGGRPDLRPRRGRDRRRGGVRWVVRRAHQRRRRPVGRARGGAGVQAPEPRRTGLPHAQGGRPAGPPHLPLQGGAGARAPRSVFSGRLRAVAPGAGLGAPALSRGGAPHPPRSGGHGRTLPDRPGQRPDQAHAGWVAGAQLPLAAPRCSATWPR